MLGGRPEPIAALELDVGAWKIERTLLAAVAGGIHKVGLHVARALVLQADRAPVVDDAHNRSRCRLDGLVDVLCWRRGQWRCMLSRDIGRGVLTLPPEIPPVGGFAAARLDEAGRLALRVVRFGVDRRAKLAEGEQEEHAKGEVSAHVGPVGELLGRPVSAKPGESRAEKDAQTHLHPGRSESSRGASNLLAEKAERGG